MLSAFFNPGTIAIIGASPKRGKVGHEILRNILESGYSGKTIPINPNFQQVLGLTCYPSTLDVPIDIDLGIIAVPAHIVPTVVQDAGKKGVKGLIIISAGFKEAGGKGAKLEKAIIETCTKYRIRLLGPNCLGVIDTHLPLNASFATQLPAKGNIAFISQSGALGTAILDWAQRQKIGLSKFVSLGNKADIDETDIIHGLIDDKHTDVILLYLEGVSRGDTFIKSVRKVTHNKPVVVLKSGITEAGARAVSSHTGSMAGSDLAFSLAFQKAGVTRVTSAEELFDLAKAFSTQPIPKGSNVVIVTNAGGPGILATDACDTYGLTTASIPSKMVEDLRKQLPPASGFFNPIDIIGDADAARYQFALETVLPENNVHSVLVILTPQAMTEAELTAQKIIELHSKFPTKPLVTSFMGGDAVTRAIKLLEEAGIPNYAFPERAVQSLAALTNNSKLQQEDQVADIPRFDVDSQMVATIFANVHRQGRLVLAANEANAIANAYGIPAPMIKLAATAEDAMKLADSVGYPIVMKIESPNIMHKTDIGGVKMNLKTADEVRTSFYELIGRAHTFYPNATVLGVNVQKMAPSGREVIIGMTRDITFGPLLMFGLGGIYVNFLKDVAFRLAPLTENEATKMVQETKAYQLLRGIRGETRSDVNMVIDTLLRISQLVMDFPEINEIDINPLFVYDTGGMAIDVKITIKPE
ncbi:MAG: acetate--CoA ligase [Candidatus Bathyarchaeota archaeon]|nr:MAG: acetate--CoA ligase [Candidatus Bathyarchaeota archaeon]